MKESISYSFLLNIIILFITVCAAIIMGIFSYYKAFRANSIITETIEKYEGYNCIAKEEIARKLGGIGYNTPFNVTCNNDGNCETDNAENGNYKVISYNLDFNNNHVHNEEMNSTYKCEDKNGINYCTTNKHYQYGVYTYMYVELPVVSNLIRLSFFSKTNPMYEFRNFYVESTEDDTHYIDVETAFPNTYKKEKIDGKIYVKDAFAGEATAIYHDANDNAKTIENPTASKVLERITLSMYAKLGSTFGEGRKFGDGKMSYEFLFNDLTKESGVNLRTRAAAVNLEEINGGVFDASLTGLIMRDGLPRNECGFIRNYEQLN